MINIENSIPFDPLPIIGIIPIDSSLLISYCFDCVLDPAKMHGPELRQYELLESAMNLQNLSEVSSDESIDVIISTARLLQQNNILDNLFHPRVQ